MAGIFGSMATGLRRLEGKVADAYPLTWEAIMGRPTSRSGVSVNVDSALQVSTVFACLRVLANGIAQVPLKLYRIADDGSSAVAKDHPVNRLIWRQPNSWMTSFEWRQMMMFHAGLMGVSVAYIGKIKGQPRELIPLVPGKYVLKQNPDWSIICTLPDGNVLSQDQLFILRGPMWQGPAGMQALHLAREAIGLAIATEETHAALHANGAQPGGILAVKSRLDDPARERLKKSWNEYQAGLRNKFKTAVLDMDATWSPMSMNGVDAQHLETRRFQIEEICRGLGVFPQMIGHTDKTATFASAEAFFLAHVVHSLAPWVENWEQALQRDLFPKDDDLIAKFSLQGLLRGDNKTRAEFYASGIVNGWLTRNEARRLEDLNPIKGLDDPLLPLNMGTQAERDALAKDVTSAVKAMLGHNGGPSLNEEDERRLELKIGRVLSATNERRIIGARDQLNDVLSTLGDS
ncbi:phage portal protein [Nitrobacter sp.]|uniref:phage portal protein n=1 Tax=Nitrobacter sp. TaxID=29420 RepID=UPI0029CAACB6|nr:phage portal protein [Nitrobacter sp.]